MGDRSAEEGLGSVAPLEQVLVELGSCLISTFDSRDAARAVLSAAERLIGWDAAYVALYEESTGLAHPLFLADMIDGAKQELVQDSGVPRVPSSLFRRCMAEGALLLTADAASTEDSAHHFGDQSRRTESLLFVPIRNQKLANVGLISLQSYTPNAYDASTLRTVSLLADLFASNLERERLAKAVRQQEKTLSLVMEELPALIWSTDRDLKLTSFVGAGLKTLGFAPNQLVGKSLAEVYHGETSRPLLAAHQGALEGRESTMDHGAFGRHYHLSIRPLRNDRHEVSGVIGVAMDTTKWHEAEAARRELEVRMLQTQRLESLGVLAGSVAHDFNNLLVGVMGHAGLALAELPQGHPARPSVQQIEEAADRMRDLARQLLGYSGRGRSAPQAMDLSVELHGAASLIRTAVTRTVDLELQPGSVPLPVHGDPARFRQLVLALAANASDAMAGQAGTVSISLRVGTFSHTALERVIDPPAESGARFAILTVADTGSGMDSETLARIFDPLFTTKSGGRGLGLAAARGIVRGFRGSITVHSMPGRGTTIRCFFPLDSQSGVTAAAAKPGSGARRLQGVVMVVDDERVILDFVRSVLERQGLIVVTARDGDEAIRVFESCGLRISMVVLDLVMPRRGGAETYIELRKRNPALPVLFISGATDVDLNRKGLAVSPEHFLPKPFTREDLLSKISSFF